MNIREIIIEILLELEKTDGYMNLLLADVLEKYDYLEPGEKAFIKRVTQGCVERGIQVDYVLDGISRVPVKKMKPFIRALLRMSAYQLLFMDAVPDAAVCNEAVKLAKKRSFGSLQGYVNGVLRNLSRQKQSIGYPDAEREPVKAFSVLYSMPVWLVEYFLRLYGQETTEKMLRAFLKRRPVTVRLEEGLTEKEREALLGSWIRKGVAVKGHPYLSYAVQVEKTEGIRHLPGYGEGLFAVQDVSSMLAVEAAGIEKGRTVLDLCAAPGGKSLHAASKLAGTGSVLSFDVTEAKLLRMEENRRRMRRENMKTAVGDARNYREELYQSADVVLADVPCSGLGVIGRKPDIKYHVTERSLAEITALQKEILQNAAAYVKPGGILLYSTCTIVPEENEKMVEWICKTFPFVPEGMRALLPEGLPEELRKAADTGMMQLLPGVHETDGFFFARLRRM
ncbi:MAG: 16S rRNA (cytosine(967)-C(5))-methyltransferase RsmB [Blautia sp.]|nr:16S rRNA (cytosine(967)-C(5))-methyltransferase RsmB [Blautia sp.]MCM1201575.1 16S rRNA (cytosine(967)-C(5))-methyltransferase RsmB [Bacteroides fragilis]